MPRQEFVISRRVLRALSLGFLSAVGMSFGLNDETLGQICQPYPASLYPAAPSIVQPTGTFRIVPQTIVEPREVTTYKAVEETSTRQRQITELKPVIRTETRERRSTVLKPVIETEMKTERYTVVEPVTETVMEERQREVIEYVEETGYREEQIVVPRTIEETQYQDRQTVVRKPVTQTYYRQTPVTSYQQVTNYKPQLVDQGTVVNQLMVQQNNDRNRLRFLQGTTYTDPTTMRQVYRRPGLYWTNQNQPATATLVPTYVPNYQVQQIAQTALVPQTTMKTEPVEVTNFVDQVVTEKVPVTVQRVENQVVTRRVPYTYQRPVTRVITEKVPVERTYNKESVIEREVPVQRTIMQTVEKVVPYEVQIKEMVETTRTVEEPVTQRRLVPSTEIRNVPRTVYYRQELDLWGNPILGSAMLLNNSLYGEPTPTEPFSGSPIRSFDSKLSGNDRDSNPSLSIGSGTTLNRMVEAESDPATPSEADSKPVLRSMKPYLGGENPFLIKPSDLELKPIQKDTQTAVSQRLST